MLRGIRTAADFEYERAIAQINKKMLAYCGIDLPAHLTGTHAGQFHHYQGHYP